MCALRRIGQRLGSLTIRKISVQQTRESMHGYGIVQRIHETAEDLLKVEDGSLYPALYRMEERGWIKSEWGVSENNRRAKFYKLTKTGQRQLEAQRSNWN